MPRQTPFTTGPMYGKKIGLTHKIEFVKHSSARRVVTAFFRYDHPRMSDGSLLAMKTDFRVFLGHRWKENATVSQLLGVARKVGAWGYCNHKSKHHKEIHYWFGKNADRFHVLELLLHETAHAGGYRKERDAVKIAGLGTFVYQTYEDDFKEGKDG